MRWSASSPLSPPGRVSSALFRGPTLVLAALAYSLFFYRDILLDDRVYVFRDHHSFIAPMDHVARLLARWHWPPLWNPLQVLGKPFAADIQNVAYYPLECLLRGFPEPLGLNLSIAVHHLIATAGMYLLLRRHCAKPPSALGAVLFGFGGLAVAGDNMLNALRSTAWLPWTMLGFEHWQQRRSFAALAALALGLAATALGAFPEVVIFENILLVARACEGARSRREPVRRLLLAIACANLLAASLCAVQVLPFLEYVAHSSRAQGLSLQLAVRYSLLPPGLLAFLVPRRYLDANGAFHEYAALWEGALDRAPWAITLYLGAALLFSIEAPRLLSRFQRLWWCAVLVVFVILSFGEHTPGYVWMLERFAFLRAIRYPEKFLVAVHAMLAVAAAMGLEHCLRRPEGFTRVARAALVLGAGAALSGALFSGQPFPGSVLGRDLLHVAAVAGALGGLAWSARTCPYAAAAGLIALAAADLYQVNGRLLPTIAWEELVQPPHILSRLERGEDPLRIYSSDLNPPPLPLFPEQALRARNMLLGAMSTLHAIANLQAPASINLGDHERLQLLIESAPRERTARILAALNTAYVTSSAPLSYPGLTLIAAPAGVLDPYLYRVEGVRPRAFVPARVRPVAPEQMRRFFFEDGDLESEVAVAPESIPAGLPDAVRGNVRLLSYLPDRVALAAEMQTAGLVVLADTAYPGWRVRVDGAEAPVVRVDDFVRGVFVAPGTHHIVFAYAPPTQRWGAAISGATVALLLARILVRRRTSSPGA